MRAKFTQSFKVQAVEKALRRSTDVTIKDIADDLGVGHSTLGKWLIQSRNHTFESPLHSETQTMSQEKRPEDWSTEERLEMVIACGSLNGDTLNRYCREKGVYSYHVTQWKQDFATGTNTKSHPKSSSELKALNSENRSLKKELNRKEKALAETAALLVLQKKANDYWGDGDNS